MCLENWKKSERYPFEALFARIPRLDNRNTNNALLLLFTQQTQGNILHELYSERALLPLHIRDRRRAQPAQESFTVHWERDEAHRERRRGVLFAVGVSAVVVETSSRFG